MIVCQAVLLFVAEETNKLRGAERAESARERGGENPELAMEQTARALNVTCRRWQERRRNSPMFKHTATVINYY